MIPAPANDLGAGEDESPGLVEGAPECCRCSQANETDRKRQRELLRRCSNVAPFPVAETVTAG